MPLGEYDEEYVMRARVNCMYQQEAIDKLLTVLFVIWPWDRALRQVRCDDASHCHAYSQEFLARQMLK